MSMSISYTHHLSRLLFFGGQYTIPFLLIRFSGRNIACISFAHSTRLVLPVLLIFNLDDTK
jgi:hypothetical protein